MVIDVEVQYQKKQYNPAAPDWALGPSAEVAEFLPHSQSATPAIVSTRFHFISVNFFTIFARLIKMDTDLDRQQIVKSTNKIEPNQPFKSIWNPMFHQHPKQILALQRIP